VVSAGVDGILQQRERRVPRLARGGLVAQPERQAEEHEAEDALGVVEGEPQGDPTTCTSRTVRAAGSPCSM
jgi:hypothetical protein